MSEHAGVELRVDELLLRPWRPADAEQVHRACQDPLIRQWTGVPDPYLAEHAAYFTGPMSAAAWADGTAAPFAVVEADTGLLAASCGLITIDPALRSAEIGFWTAPWARGRDVAARATLAVCRWAFGHRGLQRVVWQAELGNHASRLVALRAGFTVSGELLLAAPRPQGCPAGWIGALLPGALPESLLAVDPAVRRHALLFGGAQPVLADGAVRLRPLREEDVGGVLAGCRDAESLRWTTVPDPYTAADASWYVRRYAPDVWARGTGAVFAVTGPDDAYAGTAELRISAADPELADVGFLVAPQSRGRGYGTAALRALSRWALTEAGLRRVEWRAHVGNTASRRVAEKAGFVVEGVSRGGVAHRGERRDTWLAARVPQDLT